MRRVNDSTEAPNWYETVGLRGYRRCGGCRVKLEIPADAHVCWDFLWIVYIHTWNAGLLPRPWIKRQYARTPKLYHSILPGKLHYGTKLLIFLPNKYIITHLFAENPNRSTLTRTWFDGMCSGFEDWTMMGWWGFWPEEGRGTHSVKFVSCVDDMPTRIPYLALQALFVAVSLF